MPAQTSPEWNYATVWEAVADARPDALALVQGTREVTWRRFDERAACLAAAFTGLGLGRDAKIASFLYNSNEYMEGAFAAFKMRGVPVNVNYRYTADELTYMLDDSDAELLLFHGSLGAVVGEVLADRASRAPRLRAAVQVDDGAPLVDGALRYEELIEAHDPMPRVNRSGDDLYFLYTGGTTGMPKGVMWRQQDLFESTMPTIYLLLGQATPENVEATGAAAVAIAAAGTTPIHLPASPLMHGTGFFTTLQSLTAGGAIVTLESRTFDPHELWRVVGARRVRQMAIVGDAFAKPMLRALEEAEAAGTPYDLTSLQLLISSGVMWTAPVKQGLMARGTFLCLDSLGSSEGVGFGADISAPGTEPTTASFSIGEHAKVLSEDGREIPPGSDDVGMLALGGPIPLGYYKDPAKTEATFRTFDGRRYSIPGDWARVAPDGTIELLGRGSVSINTGGEKVFPEEVEEAVKLHPAVVDAVVVGVPDERWGEAVTAVVALRDGAHANPDEIADAARDHLAGFKRPRLVVVVPEVKRGANGKTDYAWARDVARRQG